MEKKVLDVRLQMLSGTLEEWQNTDFTPAAGEFIIVEDVPLKEDDIVLNKQ